MSTSSLSSSRRHRSTLRRRVPALTCGALLVGTTVGWGVWNGLSTPLTGCTTAPVQAGHVFTINFALSLLLVSGVFSFGASTVITGLFVLGPTGASVGAIVGRLGWSGVALLLPHGLLELAAWVVAATAGLAPVIDRVRWRPASNDSESSDDSPLRSTAKSIALVAVLLAMASILESTWTGWYGHRISC